MLKGHLPTVTYHQVYEDGLCAHLKLCAVLGIVFVLKAHRQRVSLNSRRESKKEGSRRRSVTRQHPPPITNPRFSLLPEHPSLPSTPICPPTSSCGSAPHLDFHLWWVWGSGCRVQAVTSSHPRSLVRATYVVGFGGWGLGISDLGLGLSGLGLGFRGLGLGLRGLGLRSRVSGFGFRVSGPGFKVCGLGFRVTD